MKRWLIWLAVAATILFCLFPFYWLVNTSLKSGSDLSSANLLPPSPTLDNYTSIFEDDAFVMALRNSAIVAGSVTILSLLIGSFAGYALARLHLPFKFLILAILLSISTFPPIAIAAPVFEIWTDIGLYNS
jgi:multiple sugar transport system permease protein